MVGIFLLLVELRQNTASAELQAAQSYVTLSYELDFRLVDDPSLIALLITPQNERTPEQRLRLDRWYFGSLRTWENGYYLHSRGVLDDDLWSGQVAFMADLLQGKEELRNYYKTNRRYFSWISCSKQKRNDSFWPNCEQSSPKIHVQGSSVIR